MTVAPSKMRSAIMAKATHAGAQTERRGGAGPVGGLLGGKEPTGRFVFSPIVPDDFANPPRCSSLAADNAPAEQAEQSGERQHHAGRFRRR